MTPQKWDTIYFNGKRLLTNLLNIEVPVIAAINGPARVHAELAVLGDITIASETTVFQDAPHFRLGTIPTAEAKRPGWSRTANSSSGSAGEKI